MQTAQPGSQLDQYAVKELIARSNTASILRATDLRTGHDVLIKIPPPEVEGDLVFYQRFLREQEICETLDRPAVVKAFPERKRDRMYIAMEVAPGQLLRQVWRYVNRRNHSVQCTNRVFPLPGRLDDQKTIRAFILKDGHKAQCFEG